MTKKTETESRNKKLLLLDVHAILHRAYHALPEFASSKGEATGALYGLSTMLIKAVKELKPDYIMACYDLPQPTYRHEVYEGYKTGRKKADSELVEQIKKSYEIFSAFNIPAYFKAGFEADDIIATIATKMKSEVDVVIASGDMDTLQLVDDKKVQVYTLKKGIKDTIMYDEKAVEDRFGFKPELVADYKGLRGDPSDNIIGIAGIGEKTATELIQKFGSIEDIYKKLKKNKEAFVEAGIRPRIVELLEKGEEEAVFSKMLATTKCDVPIDFSLPEKMWRDSVDMEKIKNLFRELEFRTLADRVSELVSSGAKQASLGDFSCASESEAETSGETLDEKKVKETGIALWLLNSTITNPTLEDILNFTGAKSFSEAREKILSEIEKINLSKVFKEIELPLVPVIDKMEKRGVKIDAAELGKLSAEYHEKLSALEKKIWELAGLEFNINSPKQMGEVLFSKLGISVKNQKKTSTGVKSTRESELEKMKGSHPVIEEILKYRELQKLLSTYIDSIPPLLAKDGRLHAKFIQAGTTTGRMSSSDPNLQNIPIKSELGRKIRRAFIAEKGFKLVSLDYSQVELRIAAFLSGDEKLIEIFRSGRDVHTEVAAKVFKVPSEKVDKEMRRKAKVINFGILYGMGILALKQNLGTDREEAQNFYNEYFATFTGLAKYLDSVKASAERQGYTETYFGRRRYFDGLNSKLSYIKSAAERMAINAPIQGTEADIIKIAMARVDKFCADSGWSEKVFPILQIHDSLMYEIEEGVLEKAAPEIKKIMESVILPEKISGIVCTVETEAGDNWEEMEKLK